MRPLFALCLVFACVAPLCGAQRVVAAGTTITSPLEHWELADSPVALNGDLTVASGASLQIDAGVVVLAAANATILILGAVRAMGVASAPVRLECVRFRFLKRFF